MRISTTNGLDINEGSLFTLTHLSETELKKILTSISRAKLQRRIRVGMLMNVQNWGEILAKVSDLVQILLDHMRVLTRTKSTV